MKKIPVRQLTSASSQPIAAGRFTIRRVEDISKGEGLMHELHRHDFFFLLAISSGSGLHTIDFTPYPVGENTVFFLRPGQVHQLELKRGSTGFLIEFNTAFYQVKDKSANLRLRKATNKNYCKPDVKRFKKLHQLLSGIYLEFTDQEEFYADAIKAGMDIFFIEFIRQSPDPTKMTSQVSSYIQERFEDFSALLELHISIHKQSSVYADLMSLSLYQLNQITKSAVGKTSSELITEYIILEAKRYLLATTNQVKDIADQLGYEDISYFIRFFKKHTGHSPEAFRNHFT